MRFNKALKALFQSVDNWTQW